MGGLLTKIRNRHPPTMKQHTYHQTPSPLALFQLSKIFSMKRRQGFEWRTGNCVGRSGRGRFHDKADQHPV